MRRKKRTPGTFSHCFQPSPWALIKWVNGILEKLKKQEGCSLKHSPVAFFFLVLSIAQRNSKLNTDLLSLAKRSSLVKQSLFCSNAK